MSIPDLNLTELKAAGAIVKELEQLLERDREGFLRVVSVMNVYAENRLGRPVPRLGGQLMRAAR